MLRNRGAILNAAVDVARRLVLAEREVVDLSFNGLCLRGTPEDLVFPGLLH